MAKKMVSVVVCDMDRTETPAIGTLEIVIDGDRRRLDLCADHLANAKRTVKPFFVTAAKKNGTRNTAATRQQAADLRSWAAKKGYELAPKGRIPSAIKAEYQAAKK